MIFISNYNELIKNLQNIREYMKDFYIYGFKTRNDFSQKSQRTYDNERRRVESWLGDLVKFNDTSRGRQVSISANCGQIYTNPLYRAYQSKSFTDNDIQLHFFILDILKNGNGFTINEIADIICTDYSFIDVQTIRNKLNEYAKLGIFQKEKFGKAYKYSLYSQLDFINKEEFQTALKFFSMVYPFGVVGYYLLNQLEIQNDTFLIKHYYIVHTLEDTILITIIQAINEKKSIEVVNFGRDKQEKTIIGIPLKVYVSTQTGRRYLIFYHLEHKRLKSIRLDFIRSVKILNTIENYNDYVNLLDKNAPYCWGISFGDLKKDTNIKRITFTIKIDMPNEKFILDRLNRECRHGKIQKVSNTLYSCMIDTFDIHETKNWIRSFIGRIVSIDCPNENIINQFRDDIKRMYEMYGRD